MHFFFYMFAITITKSTIATWDGLRVTWGWDFRNPNFFVELPRTASKAYDAGYRKIDDCNLNAPWRGSRFIKDNDYDVVLLFDIKGFIAGIQTAVPKNQPDGYPSEKIRPPFVDDGDQWIVSAYFTDPSKICTIGRLLADFNIDGTGTDLYIQNSTIPEQSVKMPFYEANTRGTTWKKGQCVPTMGNHYWIDLRENKPCDEMFPVFLLYNGGKLTAFGWNMVTYLPSQRYEHPKVANLKMVMDPVPVCLIDVGIVTSMHIYLTNNVTLLMC